MALQRIPFTVTFEGFVEVETYPMPPRKDIEAGMEWAGRTAENAEAEIEHWLKSSPPAGRSRGAYGPPLENMKYNIDLQTGYTALIRKATGEDIY